MGLHKLPYYAFVGWAGFVALAVLLAQNFFEYAVAFGWCVIAASILGFYLFTIEAPLVKCEWAGWILSPTLVLIVFAGVEPVTQLLYVLSTLALLYALMMFQTERNPAFAEKLPHFLQPLSPSSPPSEAGEANLVTLAPPEPQVVGVEREVA